MQSSASPPPKPKRYYDSVSQQLAESSQTVRGVIKPNKNLHKNDTETSNYPPNRNNPNKDPNANTTPASSSSSINNDSFYDDDDNLSDSRIYQSCYNRQKIVVAPLGKTTGNSPKQPTSPATRGHNPK